MMHLSLVVVGKLKELWAKEACDTYEKRLRSRFRFDLIELKDESQMQKHLHPKSLIWLFDERGSSYRSQDFACQLGKAQDGGRSVSLLIGGPDGFPKQMLSMADAVISLSSMTFPYQLARVIVLEQLYRASSILRNEPYHRE